MTQESLPLILEPSTLEGQIGRPGLLIVDVTKPESYSQYHVPGAVFLDYSRIIRIDRPAMGLLPDDERLSEVFSSLGIDADTHVVAYDEEGGGKAGRLLWTLDVVGHRNFSLLNGGLHAWANEGHPVERNPMEPVPSHYRVRRTEAGLADRDYILHRLGDPNLALLDTRTPEEFSGAKRFADRGGHIPGAVNMNWTQAMDPNRNLRLRPTSELEAMLQSLGVTPDKEVIVYCQTHHRSAHTYVMLKSLGYGNLKGYPGAWSEWGNRADTPVEATT